MLNNDIRIETTTEFQDGKKVFPVRIISMGKVVMKATFLTESDSIAHFRYLEKKLQAKYGDHPTIKLSVTGH